MTTTDGQRHEMKFPDGATYTLRTLSVGEIEGIEGQHRGHDQASLMAGALRARKKCHQAMITGKSGKEIPSDAREAAYYALGQKGVSLLGAVYDRLHTINESELEGFLETLTPA